MARSNSLFGTYVQPLPRTHEGAPARRINAEKELRRSVMSCMLYEGEFYESGTSIADRIKDLVPKVSPELVASIAIEARTNMHLRHVPLLLVREMARHRTHRHEVRATLSAVIQRADELAEFLAIYWKEGRTPIAASVKKGLADAFPKFDAYQLAKYNRDNPVKLRDVLRYNLQSVRAYLFKEYFQQFWDYDSPTWAGKFLDQWCTEVMRSRIEPLKKFVRTVRNHRELLLNYFRARKAFSSGIVEGLNNKAKVTMRKAYGFRTFKMLELALYHVLGKLPEPKLTHSFY